MMSERSGDAGGRTERHDLDRLSEDTTGFGVRELRTVWAVVKRPRPALEAWMTAGPDGGGDLARPLRLYLGLSGLMMVILFLRGGTEMLLLGVTAEDLDPLITASGKSRDAFMADLDGWTTLFLVPLMSGAYAAAAAPLLRWWDAENLGWRRSLRAAFAYLCAWTVPMMPLTWFIFDAHWSGLAGIAVFVLGILAFMRMGKGRWWSNPVAGLGKAVVLQVVLLTAGFVSYAPVLGIGLLGARFAG